MRRADCGPLAQPKKRTLQLEGFHSIPAPEASGGTDSRRELQRRLLAYGLAYCLTPAQREAVDLYYGRGLTMTQAAEVMGISPSAVSRRISGALGRLRRLAAG